MTLLTGNLVRLAALQKSDMAQFAEWYSNIAFLRLMNPGIAYPYSIEDEEAWYENQRKNDTIINFAIRTLAENTLIGSCGLLAINHAASNAELGIGIGDPDFQGKGYGTDAIQVLLKYAFLEMNLHRVALRVFSSNQRAINSYLKAGFTQEGVMREALRRDGKYDDIVIMGILRQEWER